MAPTKKPIDIGSIFTHNPWGPIADPGPEVYIALQSLPQEHQTAGVAAVNEALASIAAAKGKAYTQIANVLNKAGKG
jgi:hypothetical protein